MLAPSITGRTSALCDNRHGGSAHPLPCILSPELPRGFLSPSTLRRRRSICTGTTSPRWPSIFRWSVNTTPSVDAQLESSVSVRGEGQELVVCPNRSIHGPRNWFRSISSSSAQGIMFSLAATSGAGMSVCLQDKVKPRSLQALRELLTANSSRGTLSHGVLRALARQRVSQPRLETSMLRVTRPIRVSSAATRLPSTYHGSWGFVSLIPAYHPPPLRGCVEVVSPFHHVVAALRRCARSSRKSATSERGYGQTVQENAMKLSETRQGISLSNTHTAALDIRLRWPALQLVVQPTRRMQLTPSPLGVSPPGAHAHHFSIAPGRFDAVTSMARAQIRHHATVGRRKTPHRHRQKGGYPNGPIPFFPVISTTIQKGAL